MEKSKKTKGDTLDWAKEASGILPNECCSRCGSTDNIERHHLNGVHIPYGVSTNTAFNKEEDVEILCRKCHQKLHNELGTWKRENWGVNEIATGAALMLRGLSKKFRGLDLEDENLQGTPHRIARAWIELFAGLDENADDVLGTSFPSDGYNEMVILKDIEFQSMCSHHFLPFLGKAHVAYIPEDGGRVVGVSKLARVVDIYARRPQIQERMTRQIADAIEKHLKPKGLGVVIEAQHMCTAIRGVRKQSSVMTTSAMRGVFLDPTKQAREEFLTLIRR